MDERRFAGPAKAGLYWKSRRSNSARGMAPAGAGVIAVLPIIANAPPYRC